MPKVRKSILEDAYQISNNLREADIKECKAYLGCHPIDVLPIAVASKSQSYTIEDDSGTPIGIFGACPGPYSERHGIVWMMLTDEVRKYKIKFLREGHKWIEKLHSRYDVLSNFVDCRNELHIKWLKYNGFYFLPIVQDFGVGCKPFHPIFHVKE